MTDDPVVQQQQETESNDAFTAGFNDVRGTETAPEPEAEPPKAEPAEPAPEPVAPEPVAPPDPMAELKAQLDSVSAKLSAVDKLPDRIRNVEGHIGFITRELKTALAAKSAVETSGGAAPTQTEITKAAESSEKWKAIKEDYPEWADAMEEQFSNLRAGFKPPPPVDISGLRAELSQSMTEKMNQLVADAQYRALAEVVEMRHEGWEETVRSKEFDEWFKSQSKEVKDLADSPRARDAIKLVGLFKEAQKKPKEGKTQRLQNAITPQGTGVQPQPTINDDDAFERSFNETRGVA